MESTLFKHSLLIEERQLRDNQLATKQRIIRKRWIVFGAIALTILLAFSISAGVVSHQHKVIQTQLEDIQNKITQAQQAIRYQNVNKTILFQEEDYLIQLMIKSQTSKQTRQKCIRNLDLSKSRVERVRQIHLPSATSVKLSSQTYSIFSCSFGAEDLQLQKLTKLSLLGFNNFNIKEFNTQNTSISTMLNNYYGELTTLTIQNPQIIEFVDSTPKLSKLLLKNTNSFQSCHIANCSKLQTIQCENCSGNIIHVVNSSLRELSGLCNFKNIRTEACPIREVGCRFFPNLTRISLSQTYLTSLTLTASKLIELHIIDSPIKNITLFTSSGPMTDIMLRNTSLTEFQNNSWQFLSLVLENNINLTSVTQNNWISTTSIICINCGIENFTNNNIPYLHQVQFINSQRGKLRYYSNNNHPVMKTINLSFNQIRRISNNDFSSVKQLLIGSNYLGQIGIEILITNNTWGKGTLKTINITDNNISNKLPIMDRLLNFFPGVQIYI